MHSLSKARPFRLFSTNSRGLNPRKLKQLLNLFDHNSTDAVLIQETRHLNLTKFKPLLPTHIQLHSNPVGLGTAILSNSNSTHRFEISSKNLGCISSQVLKLFSQKEPPKIIQNVYIPPSVAVKTPQLTKLFEHADVIAGDINTHLPLWSRLGHSRKKTDRSLQFSQFLEKTDFLSVYGPELETFKTQKGLLGGSPDVVLTRPNLLTTAYGTRCFIADHRCLKFSLCPGGDGTGPLDEPKKNRKTFLNLKNLPNQN